MTVSPSSSPDTFLRQTRIGAAVALAVLAAAVVSDLADRPLWARHALITDVVASIVVIALNVMRRADVVAVVEEMHMVKGHAELANTAAPPSD